MGAGCLHRVTLLSNAFPAHCSKPRRMVPELHEPTHIATLKDGGIF